MEVHANLGHKLGKRTAASASVLRLKEAEQ